MPNLHRMRPYRRVVDNEIKTNTGSKDAPSKSNEKVFSGKYTDVPVPIPETGITTSNDLSALSNTLSVSRTTLSPFASVTPVSLVIPTIFSSLRPTTLNLVSSAYPTSKVFLSTTSHSTVSSISSPSPSTAVHPASAHKLPMTVVAVLAVGSAFFLLGIFIVIKACTRPTRPTRPKPSLPILDDAFADDDLYSPTKVDSPIFGGKECLSSQNESGAPTWTWTQYSENKAEALPYSQASDSDPRHGATPHAPNPISPGEMIGPSDFLFPRPPPSQSVPTTLISNTSHSGIPGVLATAASRFSIARSVSVYPASPVTPPVDGRNYTADGHPIIKRSSKLGLRKSRSDMTEVTGRLSGDSLAYDGVDLKSPQFLAHFQAEAPTVPVGRTRIKSSYYTPGSYPRMSSLPSSTSTKTKVDDIIEFNIQELPPIRTNSRKDRDTEALTSALGLASPLMETILLSPVQTLYPDDSLSVVDVKRMPSHKHSKKPAIVDTSTALGSLMLVDFGTTVSGLAARLGDSIEFSSSKKVPLQTQHDMPPRVPSPPHLPSLAQMGLEHANPEAYAEYRSPTYSIFGLYGEDRKSRLSMHSKLDR